MMYVQSKCNNLGKFYLLNGVNPTNVSFDI